MARVGTHQPLDTTVPRWSRCNIKGPYRVVTLLQWYMDESGAGGSFLDAWTRVTIGHGRRDRRDFRSRQRAQPLLSGRRDGASRTSPREFERVFLLRLPQECAPASSRR